jgi:hypothetical protein
MKVGISTKIDQSLHFTFARREGEGFIGDQVEWTILIDAYYWIREMGNYRTPPKKSVKFW